MASVIKSSERQAHSPASAFNMSDVVQRANQYLEDVQRQADGIRAEALEQATEIRRRAEQEGQQAALQAVDRMLQERVAAEMKTLLPALQKLVQETEHLKHAWQLHWQQAAIRFSSQIAEKIIRRELQEQPTLSQDLLAEALQLAVGGSEIQVRLHPTDRAMLGEAGVPLAQVLSRLGPIEFIADESVAPGGCRIDTRHGAIDATIEEQLKRIEDELSH